MAIPLSNIKSFSYSEDSKIDAGKVWSFGVISLLDKDKIATLDFSFKPSPEENTEEISQLLLIIDRDAGIDMLKEIEATTELTA